MKTKKTIIQYILPTIVSLFILGDLFSISLFQYVDEVLEVLSIIWLSYAVINKRNTNFFICLIAMFIIGVCGNIFSQYQRSIMMILEDYVLVLKFPIVFIALMDYVKYKKLDVEKSINYLYKLFCCLSIIIFFDCLYKYITIGGRVTFYKNEYAGTAGIFSFLFSYFIYSKNKYEKKKIRLHIYIFLIINFLVALMTQSTISQVMYIIVFGYAFYDNHIHPYLKGNYFLYFISIVGIFCVAYVSYDKILAYFTVSDAPRYLFFSNGFKLANTYFPFGVGLGLFGGSIAEKYYSPVYYTLGFNNIWTVRKDGGFLIDTFFPTIIGEFGYIGTIIYLLMLFKCYKYIFGKRLRLNFNRVVLLAFLLGGLTSNFLNSSIGMTIIILFVIINQKEVIYQKKIIINENDKKTMYYGAKTL